MFFSKIINFIFPSQCLICKNLGDSLCQTCFDKLEFKMNEKYEILYFYNYQDINIKKIIKQVKYHNDINLYKLFGEKIRNFILDNKEIFKVNNILEENIFILPIPLSDKDTRLYNHSEILAKYTNLKSVNLIYKHNKIKQAHAKSRQERIENMKNNISINKSELSKFKKITEELKIKNQEIFLILLDDVFTTGATINEAEKILLANNIKVNLKICLAH